MMLFAQSLFPDFRSLFLFENSLIVKTNSLFRVSGNLLTS